MTQLVRASLCGLLALSVSCRSVPTTPAPAPADLVLRNARVWTGEDARPWASAVAVRGDRIVAVGGDADVDPLLGAATQVRDLGGHMVLPGFHDSHLHPLGAGRQELGCSLAGLDSVAALQQQIARCAEKTRARGGFVAGRGWNLSLFPAANPGKELLDAVVPDRPAYFEGEDGHSGWANSRALALAGITKETPDPPGGVIERDARGEPSGTLRESALELIEKLLPEPTLEDDLASMRVALQRLAEAGITSIMDAGVDERRLEVYRLLAEQGELSVRVVTSYVIDQEQVEASVAKAEAMRQRYAGVAPARLRPSAAKIFLDGVLEGETAALLQPYDDHPETSGQLNFAPAQLAALVTRLEARGFQVHMHVIGDRAVRTALDAYQASRAVNGAHDLRPTLAHIQMIDPADIPRFAALGVVANAQALWAYPDSYIRDINTPQVGAARVERMYPFGSLHRAGARIAGGSDWPVSSVAPLEAMEVMRTRQDPAQEGGPALNPAEALDIETALRAYTTEGAFLLHHEQEVGTIAAGKLADLVVVDRDLTRIAPTEIAESRVELTISGGRVVYQRR